MRPTPDDVTGARRPALAAPRPPAAFVGGGRRLEVLDRAARPLTVIVAAAGTGKTATLALWAAHQDPSPLWFDAGRRADREALAQGCAGDSVDRAVVVDDAQELGAAELEALVGAVTRGDLHVVLACRRDLRLPVVALELSDQLTVLRGDHLRLTLEETTELVRAHAPDADGDDVAAVAARAKGWPAAVVLAAHALASAADRDTARAALVATDQPILDYLLDEVFTTLPAATRHLLLCTAHEQWVTDTSATVLSGDDGAGSRLAQLAVDGMLVTRYDDPAQDEPLWVYHPLLIDLLHRQVGRGMPDAVLVAAAHARAARYYAAVGDPMSALQHAVASAQHDLIADLLVRLGPRLLASGRRPAVQKALAAVPVPMRLGSRAISGMAALERRAARDVEGVLRIVAGHAAAEDAVGGVGAGPPMPLEVLVRADEVGVRLWLTRTGLGDVRGALADVDRLLAGESEALDLTRRAVLHLELAYARLLTDDLARASEDAQQAAVLGRAAGTPLVVAGAVAITAVLELLAGRVQTGAAQARSGLEALDQATEGRTGDAADLRSCPMQSSLHAVLGWAAWYALDRAESRRQLDLARVVPTVDPVDAALVRHLGALVLADEGDVPLAQRVVAGDFGLAQAPPFVRAIHELVRGELALAAGDVPAARAAADAVRSHGWDAEARVLGAAVELQSEHPDKVRELIAPLHSLSGSGAPRAEACVAAAAALDLAVDMPSGPGRVPEQARGRLSDVLRRCAPQRLTRLLLVDLAHPAFLPLLRQEVDAEDVGPFAAEALRALTAWAPAAPQPTPGTRSRPGDGFAAGQPSPPPPRRPVMLVRPAAPASAPAPGSWRHPGRTGEVRPPRQGESAAGQLVPVPPLTSREADVLTRLAHGDSYVDIAQHLYITQNTVKTHVASLYRKLNAGRRSEALRAAWSLGLLTEVTAASPDSGERHT